MVLAYAGVLRTEGDGRQVRDGDLAALGLSRFHSVASRVHGKYMVYVLLSYLFENLSGFHRFVISLIVTYVQMHLKLYRVFTGCAMKPERKRSTMRC